MDTHKKINQVQKFLTDMDVDGWLIYDFHKNNSLAYRFLEIPPEVLMTRRFFYWIPKKGSPIKIVHAIEAHVLDRWPGEKKTYLSWQSLEKEVGSILSGLKQIAMEYSPKNEIPYVSHVDGGTIDLIRSFGVKVVSSCSFLPHFTASLTSAQGEGHKRAAKSLDKIVDQIWNWIRIQIQQDVVFSEYDVQQRIIAEFKKEKLVTDHAPIVATNAHSADPHYEPQKTNSSLIKKGDFILIDLWAKEEGDESVFADITRVAVAASHPTDKQKQIFEIVRNAQKTAIELVRKRFLEKKRLEGWEVDRIARSVIQDAGYGDYFLHRTGHNIETSLHGSGAYLDDLEMHDVRPLLPSTCFSVEPGIYLEGEFGVRLECDIYIDDNGHVQVTGGEQEAIFSLL
jgi:Xaa-Pro aminopeptidase